MPTPKGGSVYNESSTKDDFLKEFSSLGAREMADKYKITERQIYKRRRNLERILGVDVKPPTRGGHVQQLDQHPAAIQLGIQEGHILVGSDSHYWPGIVTTAHRAFVEFAKEFKPKVIIKNGDETDFPALSRHSPIGWENRPKVSDEVDACKAMLGEIEKASPKSRRIWPCGNHDGRFETRLATVAPEYAKVYGVHLKDHFPNWEPCWAAFVNNDTVIKHRIRGGIHATRNNTLQAGRSVVTGHLHSLKVTPLSDYNGTRWGVDCGTMADPYGPQFYNYTELNPLDWRSGFCLLTFEKGKLLWPELVWVSGPGEIQFRGKVHSV
jgi:hypothetical protein